MGGADLHHPPALSDIKHSDMRLVHWKPHTPGKPVVGRPAVNGSVFPHWIESAVCGTLGRSEVSFSETPERAAIDVAAHPGIARPADSELLCGEVRPMRVHLRPSDADGALVAVVTEDVKWLLHPVTSVD